MPKFIDLTGNVYGELTVIEMLKNYKNKKRTYCKCIGIDNNIYIIRQDALQSGATKHVKGATKAGKFHDITGKKYGMLTVLCPTDERTSNSCVIWKCQCDCGNYTFATSTDLERHHKTSCGCKKRSYTEQLIVDYLNDHNINYETEKTFSGCKNYNNTQNLYFDFYFPELNIALEYDGELHYISNEHFGGEEKLKIRQLNDQIKNEYCKKNRINLIRITYEKKDEELIRILDEIIYPATITGA